MKEIGEYYYIGFSSGQYWIILVKSITGNTVNGDLWKSYDPNIVYVQNITGIQNDESERLATEEEITNAFGKQNFYAI